MAKKTESAVAKAMEVDTYKPTLELDKNIYPDIANLKIDEKINVTLKVKITNISRDRWNNDKLRVSGTIENAVKNKRDDYDEDD